MFRSEIVAQSDIVGHAGEPLEIEPLAASPREIGELLSCCADIGKAGKSEARKASLRRARAGRIWFSCAGGLVAFLFATLAAKAAIGAAVGGLLAALCYVVSAGFVRGAQTTYVGAKGIARVRHRSGGALETLSFDEVKGLYVARELRQASIAFSYAFERVGKPTFLVLGSYEEASDGQPEAFSDNPIWFALAAERAYVEHRLRGALQTLADGGEVRLAVSKREAITLSAAGMTLEPASGGVYSCPWLYVSAPGANGEMLELYAARGALTRWRDAQNPFAPSLGSELEKVIFRGSELPDGALLVALMEAKKEEAHGDGAATGTPAEG